jgi:tetratricopeptide (TPR) repeat protein
MSAAGGGAGVCPACGKPASGNFCQHCGASLGGRFCNKCGAKLEAGAKFCNQCGQPVSGGRAAAPLPKVAPSVAPAGTGAPLAGHRAAAAATMGGNNLPWWIAGAALFGLILVVGWSVVRSQNPPAAAPGTMPPGGTAAGGAMGASSIDLSSMSPRDAADRLYNHVMNDLAAGDTADAMRFQPMAVQAYQVAEPLDLDGLFHQSLLENLVDHAGALATAKRILATDPDHILGLGAAAQAAVATGDTAAALTYYKHLVAVYDTQAAKNLPEYEAHKNLLPEYRSEAEAFIATH